MVVTTGNAAEIHQLIDELPEDEFTVFYSGHGLAMWTDGDHYAGAANGELDKRKVNRVAGKYGLGLAGVWTDKKSGVHYLSFCTLEGSDSQ